MTAGKTKLPITCSKYEPDLDGRRCRHYGGRGACVLPEEFMCVEWLKANGHPVALAVPIPPPITRNFFGDPMLSDSAPEAAQELPLPPTPRAVAPPPSPPVQAAPRTAPPPPHRAPRTQVLLTLRDQDIASFKALGIEVKLLDEQVGEVWLVPTYTGKDRAELSIEHAALLAAVCAAFPGASVTSFVRKPKPALSPK